jgi:hypothetical protein
MSCKPLFSVSITQIVYDMMMVQVHSQPVLKSEIKYSIVTDKNRLVRKGYFTGNEVQLRTTHLEDGHYYFNMFIEEELCSNIRFEKKSSAMGELVLDYR